MLLNFYKLFNISIFKGIPQRHQFPMPLHQRSLFPSSKNTNTLVFDWMHYSLLFLFNAKIFVFARFHGNKLFPSAGNHFPDLNRLMEIKLHLNAEK